MFYSKLIKQIPFLNGSPKILDLEKSKKKQTKPNKNKPKRLDSAEPKKKSSIRSSSQPQETISKNQLKKDLEDIEKSIKAKGSSNTMLLKKAEILLDMGKYSQAKQILNKIIKTSKDRRITNKAKHLHSASQERQAENEFRKKAQLIDNLKKAGAIYGQAFSTLPQPNESSFDEDITQWVRNEARRARTADLPMLSHEIINIALEAQKNSPWLMHGKALSLNMMGRQEEALDILRKLQQSATGEKLTKSIKNSIKNILKYPQKNRAKINIYLATQAQALARHNSLETKYTPEPGSSEAGTKAKSLVFKDALDAFSVDPTASLVLLNSILDYFPRDGASLQLKGEIYSALNRDNEAISTWKIIANSTEKEISDKARMSISSILSKRAKRICTKNSAKEAILFFIEAHFRHNLAPVLDDRMAKILSQIEPSIDKSSNPELRQHEAQLQYNTLIVEYFEEKFRKLSNINSEALAHKPGMIRKTAPKAG